ncbi:MAG: protein kinase domain-containing protein [Acidobacteriota bacterium]
MGVCITAKLGAGGMGEVYRAHDTRLGRDVALKILPASFASDPERLARFEREARALAALNHTNIAHVYGLEGRAIVMELVEGEDLAVRLSRGAMPIDEALPIARQIAHALEAAHESNIIHRDLKPANVKVKSDGMVKVLDFGLAKVLAPDGSSSPSVTSSPTFTGPSTQHGEILGTAAYMSPEQAKGRTVDRRTDVWAFGVMLYEMLSGRRPFGGDDVTEVLAAVIRDSPDIGAVPAGTPAAVRRLLRRCLEKDPQKRLRDMGDVGVELDEALNTSEPGEAHDIAAIAAIAAPTTRTSPLRVAAAAALLIALTSAATWSLKPTPVIERPLTRFSVMVGEGNLLSPDPINPAIALSPDGRRLAYRLAGGAIKVRELDRLEPREVVNAQGGSGLWFSPDGEWLLYGQSKDLSRVRIAGGPGEVLLAKLPSNPGVHWDASGRVLFADAAGIHSLADTGGAPEVLFEASPGRADVFPQLLPGGTSVLHTRYEGGALSTVIRPLDGGAEHVVLRGFGAVRYFETGHLLYGMGSRSMAVPFDLSRRATTGPPVSMAEAVATDVLTGFPRAVLSRNGTLAYVSPAGAPGNMQLVWVGAKGEATPALAVARNYTDVRLSPDGRRAALHLFGQENDVWVADLQRGGLTRMTFTPGEDETPVWSPDGRFLAYAADRDGRPRTLYRKLADGSASTAEETIWQTPDHFHVNDWSPDGRTLLVEVLRKATSNDIVAIDVETRWRSRFYSRRTAKRAPGCRLTAGGWPTCRTSRAATRCTCSRIRRSMRGCWCQPTGASNPCGLETGGSCSSARPPA